jgi:hypothetical protein
VETILSIIAALLAIAVMVLKRRQTPEAKNEQRNEEIQKGRHDLIDGNTDAVTARVDKLLMAIKGNNRNAGKPDSKTKAG